jgi:2-polyprenyl-6-hydroxyphenyl methylase/3-demethylubiquinone-9 3-methyltransferase
LRLAPVGLHVLDIGCGGGLLAEEFARLGCIVMGVDPSEESLVAARAHAADQGLAIGYQCALGEALPFGDASFDVVYCCDVLEHVDDVPQVIAETARVLRPGGTYLYDTINRTLRSRLIVIESLQEWQWTALMPPGLHDWKLFIRPAELQRELVRHGLVPGGLTGLKPRANPLRLVRALRRRQRGLLTHAAASGRWIWAKVPTPPCPTSGTPANRGPRRLAERSIRMIIGAHSVIYSTSPEADRAFLRDTLKLPNVDVGGGWLIFGLPPAEIAVHPSERNDVQELYLMCDDVEAFTLEMKRRGIAVSPVKDEGWGILTQLTLPGGGKLGVYQPRHARPEAMSG